MLELWSHEPCNIDALSRCHNTRIYIPARGWENAFYLPRFFAEGPSAGRHEVCSKKSFILNILLKIVWENQNDRGQKPFPKYLKH